MLAYANPANFMRLSGRLLPWLAACTVVCLAVGLYLTLLRRARRLPAGRDGAHHVHPRAGRLGLHLRLSDDGRRRRSARWCWRHPLADAAQKAAAPLGAVFTFICLVTGSLWGKPMWGTYWVWDARLTSVLVLFIIYLGLVALWQTIEEPGRAARAAAILTLVGVDQHPDRQVLGRLVEHAAPAGSVFRMGGPTIDPSMLWPLLVMAVGFTLLFVTLHTIAIRNEILRRRVRRLMLNAAARATLRRATRILEAAS